PGGRRAGALARRGPGREAARAGSAAAGGGGPRGSAAEAGCAHAAARPGAAEARSTQAERQAPQALSARTEEGAVKGRWMLKILRNNGIAAVKVGDVYQILPVAEAKTRAIIPRSRATKAGFTEKDAFAIEVVPVQHVSADEMVNILQPFVTPGGDVLSYPRANLLVITDLQSNIDRLRELVTTFDSDVFHNLKTRVFKVQHGDPDELAHEILALLAPYGVTPTGEAEGGGDSV